MTDLSGFNPDGMVAFQVLRRAELALHRAGDTRADAPATPLTPPLFALEHQALADTALCGEG